MLVNPTINDEEVERYKSIVIEYGDTADFVPFIKDDEHEGVYFGNVDFLIKEEVEQMFHIVDIDGKITFITNQQLWTNSYRTGNEETITFISEYGVCDNAEQALKYFGDRILNHPDYKVFIQLDPVFKEGQPEYDGWRWEKWGEYIGDKTPRADYLFDEPEIDYVLLFKLVWIKD